MDDDDEFFDDDTDDWSSHDSGWDWDDLAEAGPGALIFILAIIVTLIISLFLGWPNAEAP